MEWAVKAPLRRILTAVAALVAAGALASTAAPATGSTATCPGGYAYAGLWNDRAGATAASATLTALEPAQVDAGHVAAWVNFGNSTSTAWLQIGLNSTPGSASHLYYEYMAPGATDTTYVELRKDVPVGDSHRVGVAEVKGKPDWWRVTVDGAPAAADIYLPGSHAKWHPSVSAESFRPSEGPCNRYSYNLSAVKVSAAGAPATSSLFSVADPGYHLERTALAGSFSASGHD
jgi:hypothetical protein